MLEFSEGDIEFLYTMKLVPPKCLQSIIYPYIIYKNTIHWKYWHYSSWHFSLTSMYLHKILFSSLYKNLRTRTEFLEMYGKGARINEFSITQYKIQPPLILRLERIVYVLGSSTTHTNGDN